MTDSIPLGERGVRVYKGRIYNHDYLWFSSNEISKLSATQPVLHNYALSYALSQRSWGVSVGNVPRYLLDEAGEFGSLSVYATPTETDMAERTTVTFNAIDSLTLTTGDSKGMNTPNLGRRVYLNLAWPRSKQEKVGFQVFAFVFGDHALPSVFRLGKKGCPMRARWEQIEGAVATFELGPLKPSHPVNPRDVSGNIRSYEPIMIPPHFVMREVTIEQDWFVHFQGQIVHVPKRVLSRARAT